MTERQEFAPGQIIIEKADGIKSSEIKALKKEIGAKTIDKTQTLGIELWEVPDKNPTELLRLLNQSEEIEYAGVNWKVTVNGFPNDPSFNSLWGMHNTGQTGGTNDSDIDAPEAWDITTGNGKVLVGIIDTGIDYNHPDLAKNIWTNPGEIAGNNKDDDGNGYVDDVHGYDFYNYDGDPFDDNSHGTHVAGTIGAVGNNGVGVAGVNWDVQMAGIKFLGADGSGWIFDAIQAVEYAVKIGADLTNNSWGGGGFDQGLYNAIKAAGAAGQVFVAAAGNWGLNADTYPMYPAAYDLNNIISVAATDHNDQLAWFSNYGVKSVDLAAPGENIYSTVPGNSYASYSGTSMASPHVAGAAALILSQDPNLTPDELKARILATVDPKSNLNGVVASGGRLNLHSALVGTEPGAIEGSKWNDLDKDGVWDNGESALAGWTIFLDKDGDKILDPSEVSTVTDANGKYVFNDLESGNYVVVEVQQPGWMQTFPAVGAGVIFNADFSDTNGNPNLDGFVVDNTGGSVDGLWHLSTRRGNEAGHSPDDSMYFGDENTGNYNVGMTAGRITSPVIDLTKLNAAQLSFNYFLQTEGWAEYYDIAKVLISENGGAFNPIASNAAELLDPTTGWTNAIFDLNAYTGKAIQIQFDFNTVDSALNNYEGWYIDDVVVEDTSDGTHQVFVGNGQTVTGVNFGNYAEVEPPIIDIDNPVKIVEGLNANGQLIFTVELSEISDAPVTVEYKTVDGTAKAGSDYTAGSGILTFNPGDTSKTINVAILDDNLIENDEVFKVVLSNPSGGIFGDNEGEGKITDTIKSATTKTLPNGVERLILTGTGNINGTGNANSNRIDGNNGNNTLNGGAGNDVILGNAGNDILIGGAGVDVLTGNGGNDQFRFNLLSEKGDTIKDFLPGTDKISIKRTGFSNSLTAGVLPASQFVLGTAPADSNDYFIYNQSQGKLYFDADGSGTGKPTDLLATFTGAPGLSATNITIF